MPDTTADDETVYVVAELRTDGKPVSYLRALAAREFGRDVTYRLTAELGEAWTFRDRASAEQHTTAFNLIPANPRLTTIERPPQES